LRGPTSKGKEGEGGKRRRGGKGTYFEGEGREREGRREGREGKRGRGLPYHFSGASAAYVLEEAVMSWNVCLPNSLK